MNQKPKVLIVDDNMINRKVMSRLLMEMNLDVTEANGGLDAVEKVKRKKFDIILMDIFMHGLNGYETAKMIRDLDDYLSTIPIIAVTASDKESVQNNIEENKLNGVVTKPLNKEDVVKIVAQYIPPIEANTKNEKSDIFNIPEFESLYDNKVLRKEILKTVMEDKDKDLDEILVAFGSKDSEKIYQKIHYLKGSFTYLKAGKILITTQKILDLCKQEKLEEALLLQEDYLNEYHEIIDVLTNYYSTL